MILLIQLEESLLGTEDTLVSLKNCYFNIKQKEVFKMAHFYLLSSACFVLRGLNIELTSPLKPVTTICCWMAVLAVTELYITRPESFLIREVVDSLSMYSISQKSTPLTFL